VPGHAASWLPRSQNIIVPRHKDVSDESLLDPLLIHSFGHSLRRHRCRSFISSFIHSFIHSSLHFFIHSFSQSVLVKAGQATMTGIMTNGSNTRVAVLSSSGANRCRADSGSTYSSSDTSNPTSSRRRSHRPRGCRGGSSRKKRHAGKVPKEIVSGSFAVNDSAISGADGQQCNSNITSNTTKAGVSTIKSIEKPKVLLKGSSSLVVLDCRNPKASVGFADGNPQRNGIADENEGRTNALQPNKHVPLTSNTATFNDNNKYSHNNSNGTKEAEAQTSKARAGTSSSTYSSLLPPLPPMQESIKALLTTKDTSSHHHQHIHGPSFQPSASSPIEAIPATTVYNGSNRPSFSQILPPLYHPEQVTSEPTDPPPPRVNIYALKNSSSNAHIKNCSSNSNVNLGVDHLQINHGILPNSSYPYNIRDYQSGRGSQQPYNNCYDNHNRYNQYGANPTNAPLLQLQQQSQQHPQLHGRITGSTYINFVNSQGGPGNDHQHHKYHDESEYAPGCHTGENHPENSFNSNNNYTGTNINGKLLRKSSSKSSNSNMNHLASVVGPATNAYRNERIEKQRQMMAGGGSLFVTSPKSFLMGWKSSDGMPRL
jgi:hypothetical protein